MGPQSVRDWSTTESATQISACYTGCMSGAAAFDSQGESEESDAGLVERARLGQVEAFARIYDRYAAKLLTIARRMLGADDAEDLLHDVFIEAWQSIREYDAGRASLLTWLSVRVRSRAIDRLVRRSRERQARALLGELAPKADNTYWTLEHTLCTRAALARLETTLRDAVELMYVAGLTAPEISAQFGIAEGTVRSRVARGLSQLERALRSGGSAP